MLKDRTESISEEPSHDDDVVPPSLRGIHATVAHLRLSSCVLGHQPAEPGRPAGRRRQAP